MLSWPGTVLIANRFMWEVNLTWKWDALFESVPLQGGAMWSTPIHIRKLGFNPGPPIWLNGTRLGDQPHRTVIYSDHISADLRSGIVIGVRKLADCSMYHPYSIKFDILVSNKNLAEELGIQRVVSPLIEFCYNDHPNCNPHVK